MKKVLLMMPLFWVLSFLTVAQPSTGLVARNALKIGVGATHFGYGDIGGIMQFTQFSRDVLPHWVLETGFSLAQASSITPVWRQAAAKTADLNLAFRLGDDGPNLKVGTGLSARHLTSIYSTGTRREEGGPQNLIETFEKQAFTALGYTAFVEYEFRVGQRWVLGSRASYQNYRSGSTVLFLGLNGGVRF